MVAKKNKKKNKNKGNIEIKAVGIIVLALISFASLIFTDQTGYLGILLKEIQSFLAGEVAWVIPMFLLVVGGVALVKRNLELSSRFIGFGILLILVIIGTHMDILLKSDFFSRGEIIGENMDLLADREGGGLIGSFFTTIFLLTLGEIGTLIVLIAGGFLAFLLMTNITVDQSLRYSKTILLSLWDRFSKVQNGILWLKGVLFSYGEKTQGETKGFKESKVEGESTSEESLGEGLDGVRENVDLTDNVIEIENFKKFQEQENDVAEDYNSGFNEEELKDDNTKEVSVIDFEAAKDKNFPHKKDKGKTKGVEEESGNHENMMLEDDLDFDDYELPGLDLLKHFPRSITDMTDERDLNEKAKLLIKTLDSFGVKAKVTRVQRGPTVTRYEIQPAPGVKVSKIVNLADDIALSLAASEVRIEAPIPGKAAVGIEVPNDVVSVVYIRDVLESEKFQKASSPLTLAIGKDITGEPVVEDLAKMPHLLIAGATGSGKSVCINSLIASILYKTKPDEVKFLLIDPKVVELKSFDGIPHLLAPVVTDPKSASSALKKIVKEMESRYRLFADADVKDIKSYNLYAKGNELKELPYIVVIIDELADLMMVASSEVEDAIFRLAQMSRAAGIHLIVATQRPSVDVITGVIKSNITTRIAFAVTSQTNSRTILDSGGAEKLLGEGDMLYSPVNSNKLVRVQSAFISDKDVSILTEKVKEQAEPEYNEELMNQEESYDLQEDGGEEDELLDDAIRLVLETGQASISLIQRRFRIGYTRAARLMDDMEKKGIVGGFEGSKPRKILLSEEERRKYLKKENASIDNNRDELAGEDKKKNKKKEDEQKSEEEDNKDRNERNNE